VVLIALEIGAAFYLRRQLITFQEAIMNFGTQLCNQTTNVLLAVGVVAAYGWLWGNYRLLDITMTPLLWVVLFLSVDFIFYWVHRWAHATNIGWAAHSPHHSAQEMNFFVALRASVTMRLYSFFFFWPLTLIGFEPKHIVMMTGIHLFQAFLHHTELVPKLWKPIEYIFTTPSHHRVHHGMNFAYLDKNFSEFAIIWDRLFGTFAQETEKVAYGMYGGPTSWYGKVWALAQTFPHTLDKFKVWFMPLTWRPAGVPAFEPLQEVNANNQVKFETTPFAGAKPYLALHAVLCLLLTLLVIKGNSQWSAEQRWAGAALLWLAVFNWSGILESARWLRPAELARLVLTAGAFLSFSPTNGLEQTVIVAIALVSVVWVWLNFKQNSSKTAAHRFSA
jgi:alkylglycerol monooxygenase